MFEKFFGRSENRDIKDLERLAKKASEGEISSSDEERLKRIQKSVEDRNKEREAEDKKRNEEYDNFFKEIQFVDKDKK